MRSPPALGGNAGEKKTRGFGTYLSVTVTSASPFLQLQGVLVGADSPAAAPP